MENRTEISVLIRPVLNGRGNALFFTPPFYPEAKTILFRKPAFVKEIRGIDDIREIENRRKLNPSSYGTLLLDYEFGFRIEAKMSHRDYTDSLATGLYYEYPAENAEIYEAASLSPTLKKKRHYKISNQHLSDSPDEYRGKIARLKEYIAKGETYQINLTTESRFQLEGDLLTFIADLMKKQSAQYITLLNTGSKIIISVSPELFFRVKGNEIITAPMKGTIKRGRNLDEDERQKEHLKNSEKEKAENLMIVDLLRNDLGKICEFGSIRADRLFEVETLETVHQMVSYITGKLRQGTGLTDIISALFPCGSVTGAPKFRSMEIINEIEERKRGLYTGSIFLFTPDEITANVAIRTAELTADPATRKHYSGILPLGSGVVWDSTPEAEYAEIEKKGEFLMHRHRDFLIFETMYFDGESIPLLHLHLSRLKNAASFFLYRFDEMEIMRALQDNLLKGEETIIKVLISKWGEVETLKRKYEKITRKLRIFLSSYPVNSGDTELYFKSTLRGFYTLEYKQALQRGYDEVIFMNELGRITEGSWTNFFYEMGGQLYTPEQSEGLLNGVLRQKMLSEKKLKERNITPAELSSCGSIYLGNSVRGLMPVAEIIHRKKRVFYNKN
ncbi:MAG: aminodeoxychorismate synthase, component I [Ignavibacteriales bacterium]